MILSPRMKFIRDRRFQLPGQDEHPFSHAVCKWHKARALKLCILEDHLGNGYGTCAALLSIGDSISSEGAAALLAAGCSATATCPQPQMHPLSRNGLRQPFNRKKVIPCCTIQVGKTCNYMFNDERYLYPNALLDNWRFLRSRFDTLVNLLLQEGQTKGCIWDLVIQEKTQDQDPLLAHRFKPGLNCPMSIDLSSPVVTRFAHWTTPIRPSASLLRSSAPTDPPPRRNNLRRFGIRSSLASRKAGGIQNSLNAYDASSIWPTDTEEEDGRTSRCPMHDGEDQVARPLRKRTHGEDDEVLAAQVGRN